MPSVAISPGSLGHCFIRCVELHTAAGDQLYKLAEGYTPAQASYILQNIYEPPLGVWHHLAKGTMQTASCTFTSYQLKKFD